MWELYDELIKGIPINIMTDSITVGLSWTAVSAGKYCGTAMTVAEQDCPLKMSEIKKGQSLKALASLIKSWNFTEASIGTAAVNAYYNNKETFKTTAPAEGSKCKIYGSENAFEGYAQAVKGKNVAVIGHFRQLEKYLTEANKVSILERRPIGDDYPDSACEFILPEQDYVFITGSAIINKTLPRLLQLSQRAKVIMVGPSTPMTPILFKYGICEMSGFLAENREELLDAVSIGDHQSFFRNGEKIRMVEKDV